MITRRDTLKLSAAAAAAFAAGPSFAAGSTLEWTFFQADEDGFRRTPVLLTGAKDAVLIDGGFTLSDGRAVADAIKAKGKNLTTIFVTCGDPDYYFSLRPIVEAFPQAKVLARPDTIEAINKSVQGKIEVWGPQLKDNGPQKLADVVIPEPFTGVALDLEGNALEIVDVADLHDRHYVFVPSLEAVFGGVLVYSGIHVWVADAATPELRAQWVKALDAIKARNPKILIPGHQTAKADQGLKAVAFTRDYLVAFDEEAARTKDSAELIAALLKRYPALDDASSLELGAKVAKGEMKWG